MRWCKSAEGPLIEIGALSDCLGCDIRLVYMPREKPRAGQIMPDRVTMYSGDGKLGSVCISLRPGHYDLLYRRDRDRAASGDRDRAASGDRDRAASGGGGGGDGADNFKGASKRRITKEISELEKQYDAIKIQKSTLEFNSKDGTKHYLVEIPDTYPFQPPSVQINGEDIRIPRKFYDIEGRWITSTLIREIIGSGSGDSIVDSSKEKLDAMYELIDSVDRAFLEDLLLSHQIRFNPNITIDEMRNTLKDHYKKNPNDIN